MAKSYQTPDPLHGNGKAFPHPKRANSAPDNSSVFPRPLVPKLVGMDAQEIKYERVRWAGTIRRCGERAVDVKRVGRATLAMPRQPTD